MQNKCEMIVIDFCFCVHVREGEVYVCVLRACVSTCVRECVRACVRACVHACEHACVRACVCLCVCVRVYHPCKEID